MWFNYIIFTNTSMSNHYWPCGQQVMKVRFVLGVQKLGEAILSFLVADLLLVAQTLQELLLIKGLPVHKSWCVFWVSQRKKLWLEGKGSKHNESWWLKSPLSKWCINLEFLHILPTKTGFGKHFSDSQKSPKCFQEDDLIRFFVSCNSLQRIVELFKLYKQSAKKKKKSQKSWSHRDAKCPWEHFGKRQVCNKIPRHWI